MRVSSVNIGTDWSLVVTRPTDHGWPLIHRSRMNQSSRNSQREVLVSRMNQSSRNSQREVLVSRMNQSSRNSQREVLVPSPATRNPHTSPTCSTQRSPKTRGIKMEGAVKCIYYRGSFATEIGIISFFSLKGQFLMSHTQGLLGKLFPGVLLHRVYF
jgi:hypothetical protein